MENNIKEPLNYASDTSQRKKYPNAIISGVFFSITTIFLIYGSIILPFKNNYLRSGMGEVLFVLLPAILFLIIGKYDLVETLKLKKTKKINYLIVVFLMISAIPVVGALNGIVLLLIKLLFGKILPVDQILITDAPTLLIAILVIGISAALCEEVLFRGLINKGYERYGFITSLILTSILFGILHRDIQKTVSTVVLGALIGFIVHRTKSIYTGMVAHFTNNTAAVLLTYSATKMADNFDINQAQNLDFFNLPTPILVIVIIFYTMIFLGFVAAFIALFYAFCKSTKSSIDVSLNYNISLEDRRSKFSWMGLVCVLPGVMLILLTFLGQLLELMGETNTTIYNILKILWLAS